MNFTLHINLKKTFYDATLSIYILFRLNGVKKKRKQNSKNLLYKRVIIIFDELVKKKKQQIQAKSEFKEG